MGASVGKLWRELSMCIVWELRLENYGGNLAWNTIDIFSYDIWSKKRRPLIKRRPLKKRGTHTHTHIPTYAGTQARRYTNTHIYTTHI